METCSMTEFEMKALELLADISVRLRKIEQASEHFHQKSKQADDSLRSVWDLSQKHLRQTPR